MEREKEEEKKKRRKKKGKEKGKWKEKVVHCEHASILHSYGDMKPQMLDGRAHESTHARTLTWFYTLSNAI